MIDPAIQILDMDRKGIDRNVISTSTVVQSSWWAEPKLAAEVERRADERIAEWVTLYPKRFTGSFTLPMQNIDLALKELDHAVAHL